MISGRGWVAIDFDIDENKLDEIKITQTNIPVHEVRFDPAARKKDLSDASYIFWDRWLSLEDFCVKYPDYKQFAVRAFENGSWPKDDFLANLSLEDTTVGHDMNDESDYDDPLDVHYYDAKKKQLRVCHMEYWKFVKKYFYFDPEAGEWKEVEGKWKDFQNEYQLAFPGKELRYETTIQKELWWVQFCGDTILVHAKSPIDYPGFSIVPCFLYSDVSRRTANHFGIVELMIDSQKEINKRTSQTLNLFNQQVQPGVYAEPRAFINDDQAEQSLKEAGSVTWLQEGAISQQKFMERSVPQLPTSILQMGEYMREMLRHITGINPYLLGMNDKRREAGIVVQLRQQQGMAILKPVFAAYQEMRKQLFERQIRIIMAHMPMTQIKKILGEGDRYQIVDDAVIQDTLTNMSCDLSVVGDAAYDLDAEPESNSMTANSLEIATFMELQQAGIPVDPKVIVNKTNIPVTEKVAWINYIDAQMKAGADQADWERKLEERKLEMQHEREMAKIEANIGISERKIEDAKDKDILKSALDERKLQAVVNRDEQTAQIKMAALIAQAKNNDVKAKQEMIRMMLEADIDRKRLILNTFEIMSQAGFAGDELEVKAMVDMYKAALNYKTVTKAEEIKMATSLATAFINAKSKDQGEKKDGKTGEKTKPKQT